MPRPFSAFAALELEPGADRAAIEAAYRRLIKLHHPDREGGDGTRAAEINRAYRELRDGSGAAPAPTPRPSQHRPRQRRRRRISRWPLVIAGLLVIALMQGDGLIRQGGAWADRLAALGAAVPPSNARATVARNSALDGSVDMAAVSESVGDAIRLVKAEDDAALAKHSRDCHRSYRREPRPALLDRCAAFDSAVAALQDRDPDQDSGQFNASSVTARQMTAASLLTADYLAIERRLNRIRSEVELALMPPAPPPVEQETFGEANELVPADPEAAVSE